MSILGIIDLMTQEDKDMIKKRFKSPYEDHRRSPTYARYDLGHITFPCGHSGACKPCGKIAMIDSQWRCYQHYHYGCPSKEAQAKHVVHDWGQVQCKTCGVRRGWRSVVTSLWYETKRKAIRAGENFTSLVRASGREEKK